MNRMTIALVSSILFLFPTSTAYSQDSTGGDDWSFELAPLYLWGTSITGDMTLEGNEAEVDAGLGDIFDNLNGFFTIHFDTAWKQKWGGFVDAAYGSLEASKDTPLDGTITPKLTMFISEFAGFYRLNKGAHKLDFFGGIRYTDIDGKLEFSDPLGTQKGSESWVDPMFGLLWKWKFADKWAFRARGDIGGFGAGSDFAWSAAGLVDWRPWNHVGFWFGYRALYQDYKTGSDPEEFAFDATMHGPIIALNMNW